MNGYMIDIYHYGGQYIFVGNLDIYYPKYNCTATVMYREPTLAISDSSDSSEILSAIEYTKTVMEDNYNTMYKDGLTYTLMEQEKITFKNMKVLMITASKKAIESAPSVLVIVSQNKCMVGIYQVETKQQSFALERKEFPDDVSLEILASCAVGFLRKYPQRVENPAQIVQVI